ncbi:MAG: glycosyltransferase [Desulfobacterales bacterium]|nr:glycosyltransferase [Desulfobacterales bacterium]|tara:strand:+ start:45246 stop:46460 length:1215 start_codon:yes stop_codon:yes gene_type:complete
MRNLHILIIPSEAYLPEENPLSGIFERDEALILKKAGYRIGILSPNLRSLRFIKDKKAWLQRGWDNQNDDGIPVYRYSCWNWFVRFYRTKAWWWLNRGMRLFKKYIHEHGLPDLIHCHNAMYAGLLSNQVKRKFNIPYVVTEQSSEYAEGFFPSGFFKKVKIAYGNADRLIVVSPKLGNLLGSTFDIPIEKRVWIPLALDSLFEDKKLIEVTKTHQKGIFCFLSVGRLDKNKSHSDLLFAFEKKFKNHDNIQLQIVGEGPLMDYLQDLSKKLKIDKQVKFLGYLDRSEVLREMDDCNVFVLPSHYETFGLVLVEALSRGKTIVATACGGPECIVNKDNGLLVPIGDIQALANAMESMYFTIRNFDASSIRKSCLTIFGKDAIKNRLSDVYTNVMNKTIACGNNT